MCYVIDWFVEQIGLSRTNIGVCIRSEKCSCAAAGGRAISGVGCTSDCDRPSLEIKRGQTQGMDSVSVRGKTCGQGC